MNNEKKVKDAKKAFRSTTFSWSIYNRFDPIVFCFLFFLLLLKKIVRKFEENTVTTKQGIEFRGIEFQRQWTVNWLLLRNSSNNNAGCHFWSWNLQGRCLRPAQIGLYFAWRNPTRDNENSSTALFNYWLVI